MSRLLMMGLLALAVGFAGTGWLSWLQVGMRDLRKAAVVRTLADISFSLAISGLFATIFAVFFNITI